MITHGVKDQIVLDHWKEKTHVEMRFYGEQVCNKSWFIWKIRFFFIYFFCIIMKTLLAVAFVLSTCYSLLQLCAKQSIKLWSVWWICFPNKKNYKSFNKLLHVISMQGRCEIFQPNWVLIFNKLATSTDMFKIHTLNLLIFS